MSYRKCKGCGVQFQGKGDGLTRYFCSTCLEKRRESAAS